MWFEIDYTSAFTATNPGWTFSATPGWGEPQWAPNGSSSLGIMRVRLILHGAVY